MKNKKGITLIALVVTIILLIILSGVTLNLVMGENGLIKRAKHSGQEHDIARVKEKLELEKTEVALDNYNVATLNSYINKIISRGIIENDDILNKWNIKNGSCYIQVENYRFKIEEDNKNIGNVKITYVEEIANSELDSDKPEDASVVITGDTTQLSLPASLTVTVKHNDVDSGINISSCKYVLNNNSDFIGTEESAYTGGTFESNEEEIPINLSGVDDWYLHILSVDNAENAKETIIGPISVSGNGHSHVSSCYRNHSHSSGCYSRCGGSVYESSYPTAGTQYSHVCQRCGYTWWGNCGGACGTQTCIQGSLICSRTTDLVCSKTSANIESYTIIY